MIPLKLKLTNFLSYGDSGQEVDFEPHNLICLAGKNGHGKSALLDAMTWALWDRHEKLVVFLVLMRLLFGLDSKK